MKPILLLLVVLFTIACKAQQPEGFFLSANPFSVLEPQAAYGAGLGYRFNNSFELSYEYATLGKSLWGGDAKYPNLAGYRTVGMAKFTLSRNEETKSKSFAGVEWRTKKYTYDDVQSFTNPITNYTYKDYKFKSNIKVFGFAGIIGKQWDLGEESPWCLELVAGVGLRFKNIDRENTPPNAFVVPKDVGFAETPNYVDTHTSVYFPCSIRIMVTLFGRSRYDY